MLTNDTEQLCIPPLIGARPASRRYRYRYRRYLRRNNWRTVRGKLVFASLLLGPFLVREGRPLEWRLWPSFMVVAAAFGVRAVFDSIYPPIPTCPCRATDHERFSAAGRGHLYSLVTLTGIVHAVFLCTVLLIQPPDVRGSLEQAWNHIKRAVRAVEYPCPATPDEGGS